MKDNIIYKKTINCGKCDAMCRKRKDCTAVIELELRAEHNYYDDKNYIEFSCTGNIHHTATRCWYHVGQCIDTIAELIPTKKIKRICEVWKRYHLNGMHAGCEHQRHLEHESLEHIGEICPVCGYRFGSAWRCEELPTEIIEEIKSW